MATTQGRGSKACLDEAPQFHNLTFGSLLPTVCWHPKDMEINESPQPATGLPGLISDSHKQPHPSLIWLLNRATELQRLEEKNKDGGGGGGGCKAISALQQRMIQVECSANLNPKMTDVFSMVFY